MSRPGVEQLDLDYAEAIGSSGLGDILGLPCQSRLGPYGYLAGDDCSLTYRDLGLPPQTVDFLDALSDISDVSKPPTTTTEISYDPTGHRRHIWEDGRHTFIESDADGRPWLAIDPAGNQTRWSYSLDGWPERKLTTFEGVSVHDVHRRYDDEGRLLARCTAIAPGGCDAVLDTLPGFGTISDPGRGDGTPRYQLEQWRYSPEGRLVATADPEGSMSFYFHDRRGHVVGVETTGVDEAESRKRSHTYDHHGRLIGTFHGTLAARMEPGVLHESFGDFDDLDRPHTHVDTRRQTWLLQYDFFDNLVHRHHQRTGWTELLSYNAHGELVSEGLREPGMDEHTTEYLRLPDGRLLGIKQTGEGARLVTFDTAGNEVFSRDAEGNMHVRTWDGPSRVRTAASVRKGGEKDPYLTTGSVTVHDENLLPTQATIFGKGAPLRTESWRRDSLGRVNVHTNPEGVQTVYKAHTLLGWPLEEAKETDAGFDAARFTYNARGQVLAISDPTDQLTRHDYTGFGELAATTKPHHDQPVQTYTYDHLGRISTLGRAHREHSPVERIAFDYEPTTGDLVQERWLTSPISAGTLIERKYDDLGRLRHTVDYNPALVALGVDADDARVDRSFNYDQLGRITRESIQAGGGHIHGTDSIYQPDGPGGLWTRTVAYPSGAGAGTVLTEHLDGAGRIAHIDGQSNLERVEIAFDWVGELYAGRTQWWSWDGGVDPLRERSHLDELGQRTLWAYSAVDVDASGVPVHPGWADAYCGGLWTEDCNRPLLHQEAIRDVMGRIGSLTWQFGHPAYEPANGSSKVNTAHLEHWRGYTYDKRGALTATWRHQGAPASGVDDGPLRHLHHSLRGSDVEGLGELHRSVGAVVHDYVREEKVGRRDPWWV